SLHDALPILGFEVAPVVTRVVVGGVGLVDLQVTAVGVAEVDHAALLVDLPAFGDVEGESALVLVAVEEVPLFLLVLLLVLVGFLGGVHGGFLGGVVPAVGVLLLFLAGLFGITDQPGLGVAPGAVHVPQDARGGAHGEQKAHRRDDDEVASAADRTRTCVPWRRGRRRGRPYGAGRFGGFGDGRLLRFRGGNGRRLGDQCRGGVRHRGSGRPVGALTYLSESCSCLPDRRASLRVLCAQVFQKGPQRSRVDGFGQVLGDDRGERGHG